MSVVPRCDVCLYCVVVRELTLACMFSVLQMPLRRRSRPTAQVVVDYLEGSWGLCPDGRMSFIGHVRATKYVRGQIVREWDEEWAEWSTPAEDPRLGVSAVVARVPGGPATALVGSPLVGPDRERAPGEQSMFRGMPAPGASEASVTGRLRPSARSRVWSGEQQDGSQASSIDSAPVCSSWWDTSSESDPQTDSAGFSYTSFHR